MAWVSAQSVWNCFHCLRNQDMLRWLLDWWVEQASASLESIRPGIAWDPFGPKKSLKNLWRSGYQKI